LGHSNKSRPLQPLLDNIGQFVNGASNVLANSHNRIASECDQVRTASIVFGIEQPNNQDSGFV